MLEELEALIEVTALLLLTPLAVDRLLNPGLLCHTASEVDEGFQSCRVGCREVDG